MSVERGLIGLDFVHHEGARHFAAEVRGVAEAPQFAAHERDDRGNRFRKHRHLSGLCLQMRD